MQDMKSTLDWALITQLTNRFSLISLALFVSVIVITSIRVVPPLSLNRVGSFSKDGWQVKQIENVQSVT